MPADPMVFGHKLTGFCFSFGDGNGQAILPSRIKLGPHE